MFAKVLIANRGEIAVRVARACRELGIPSVAVHSTADTGARWTQLTDEAVCIGPPPSKRSYLHVPSIIEAALAVGADAVHPGYGFLSEDPDFAEVCADSGLTFIGPPPHAMALLGDKATVRKHMVAAGLPVLPGSEGTVASLAEAEDVAERIGYPVMVRGVGGGGGRGIATAATRQELAGVFRNTVATARLHFGNGDVYLEHFAQDVRHVEVQLLADRYGSVVHLGERDCSLQRRRQKLVEESPAPLLSAQVRRRLGELAVSGLRSVDYCGAATMEFLVDAAGQPTFMEVNARIQVEHPVTEMVTGRDIVAEQILVAAGRPLSFDQSAVDLNGWAIECRINAEDPDAGFRPTPGPLTIFRPPGGPGVRVDSGFVHGDDVPAYYDSLVAKLIVWAPDRAQAISRMDRALSEFTVSGPGISTTIPLARRLLAHPTVQAGEHTTAFVDSLLQESERKLP